MTEQTVGRTIRGCDVCRQVDDHPRHVLGVPGDWPGAVPADDVIDEMIANGLTGPGVREQLDPTTVVRHPDCCAAAGCYDGSCTAMLDRHDGKTRQPLVEALEAETERLNGKDRVKILATLPRQGLTPERERALRAEQRAALQAQIADLDAADAAAEG